MRKRIIRYIYLFFFTATTTLDLSAQVRFYFESFKNERIRVSFRDSSYLTNLNDSSTGVITIAQTLQPGYAIVYGPRSIHTIYLIPGSKQYVNKYTDALLNFNGAGKEINEYLNNSSLIKVDLDYNLEEKCFIHYWKQISTNLMKNLDSLNLPDDFKYIERKRLYYLSCNLLQGYPIFQARKTKDNTYTPTDTYYQLLDENLTEDKKAYELVEYRQAFRLGMRTLALKNNINDKPINNLKHILNYLEKRLSHQQLIDYLTHTYMYEYIKDYGTKGIDKLLPHYKKNVTNSMHKYEFQQIYDRNNRLAKGNRAPNFSLKDNNGRLISLADFSGQYVYIDVWATWCAPCLKEIPALKRLEQHFSDKPITFISISIDSNLSDWMNRIREENLQGIQLHAYKNSTFKDEYQITHIPRFILIDPKGKIIDAMMTRPSDPKTLNVLNSLL